MEVLMRAIACHEETPRPQAGLVWPRAAERSAPVRAGAALCGGRGWRVACRVAVRGLEGMSEYGNGRACPGAGGSGRCGGGASGTPPPLNLLTALVHRAG